MDFLHHKSFTIKHTLHTSPFSNDFFCCIIKQCLQLFAALLEHSNNTSPSQDFPCINSSGLFWSCRFFHGSSLWQSSSPILLTPESMVAWTPHVTFTEFRWFIGSFGISPNKHKPSLSLPVLPPPPAFRFCAAVRWLMTGRSLAASQNSQIFHREIAHSFTSLFQFLLHSKLLSLSIMLPPRHRIVMNCTPRWTWLRKKKTLCINLPYFIVCFFTHLKWLVKGGAVAR